MTSKPKSYGEVYSMPEAVEITHNTLFFNQGERCAAGSRTLVHEDILDAFVKKSTERAGERVVWCPLDSNTVRALQIDDEQFNKILGLTEVGKKEGENLECGGGGIGNKGDFVQHTVFSNVKDNMRIAKEEIQISTSNQNRASDAQVTGTTATGITRKYITYEEALKRLEESSERHLNDGYFMDRSDPKTKSYIDLVQKEISQYVVGDSIKDLNLRGRKSKAFTAWVLLQEDAEFRVNESFLGGGKYGNPEVTAVTLLIPGEEKRGLRISIDEDRARVYEIVNGSYNITFAWKVDDKDCGITMNVSINGTVICTKTCEGLILEDLAKNKDVKIRIGGTKNRKMTLTELVLLNKQQDKSHEVVKFVTKGPEAKSTLETLGSQL